MQPESQTGLTRHSDTDPSSLLKETVTSDLCFPGHWNCLAVSLVVSPEMQREGVSGPDSLSLLVQGRADALPLGDKGYMTTRALAQPGSRRCVPFVSPRCYRTPSALNPPRETSQHLNCEDNGSGLLKQSANVTRCLQV